MHLRLLLFLFFFIVPFLKGWAQYFQFSQYNYTEQRVNPALIATTNYATASFVYRNQTTAGGFKLNSNILSLAYPFLSKKDGRRLSGAGITVMDDRTGQNGIFNTQEVAVSYAANVYLDKFRTLTLGLKGLYQFRKINLDGLMTGEQYIPDHGFDGSISSGENFQSIRNNFFTLSAGLYWQQVDVDDSKLTYWGVTLFDFNKPQDSFGNITSTLNPSWVAQGGIQIYKRDKVRVMPEFLYTRCSGNNVLNLGGITRYDLSTAANEPAGDHVDLITKYVVGRSGIIGLQFWKESFSVGLSYDFPVLKKNVGNLGAFEIAIQFRKLVSPKLKNRRVVNKKSPAKKPNVVQRKSSSQKPVVKSTAKPISKDTTQLLQKKSLSASLQAKQDSVMANAQAGQVTHEPLVLEKIMLHFNFEFNSSEMDESSKKQLDDLTTALEENEHLKIKLTGHTDNIGSIRFNQRLSVYRAAEIKNYLIRKGIDPQRIEADGKGMSEPVNENKTEEDRAKNRRVELTIFYTQ